jgi:uncharacterized protein (DUF697 family)
MPDGPSPQDQWITHPAFGVPSETLKVEGGGGPVSEVEFQTNPIRLAKTELGYVTGEGTVAFSLTYGPAGAEGAGVAVKFKGKDVEIEKAIETKLSSGVTLSGSGSLSATEGSVGVGLKLPDSNEARKHSISFKIIKVDEKKGELEFAVLEWEETVPLISGTLVVKGLPIKYAGSVVISVKFTPNKERIAIELAKRFGITIGEDAAASLAAGGTGTLGSAAIAAAASPVVVVTGGIFGGVALTAGVCAGIGKLEDLGKDCTAVCQEGQRQLREYSASYGSAMRGNPGGNPQGNQDAEADLQATMRKTPGTTHDQAVAAAKQSGQNFENIAYRRLLPVMRDQVTAAYKAKEGRVGWFFSYDTFEIVLNVVLDKDSRY